LRRHLPRTEPPASYGAACVPVVEMLTVGCMNKTVILAAAAAVAVSALASGVYAADTGTPQPSEPAPVPVLVEDMSCNTSAVPTSTIGEQSLPSGTAQVVSVNVPASAFIKLDDADGIVAAATNTGCAPRASDDIWLFRTDGTIVPGDASFIQGRTWTGDFTVAGAYQEQ
jgi:hypothetical protein